MTGTDQHLQHKVVPHHDVGWAQVLAGRSQDLQVLSQDQQNPSHTPRPTSLESSPSPTHCVNVPFKINHQSLGG